MGNYADKNGYYFSAIQLDLKGTQKTNFGQMNGIAYHFPVDSLKLNLVNDACIQNDGKIIIVGENYTNNQMRSRMCVLRLNPDGTRDNSYANNGANIIDLGLENNFAKRCTLQSDGKLILVGRSFLSTSNFSKFAALRLTADKLVANFVGEKLNQSKDSIYAKNTSIGHYIKTQWYTKRSGAKTNIDTGQGFYKNLLYKIQNSSGFDSLCIEVSNSSQTSSKCKLLKLTISSISNTDGKEMISIYPNPSKGIFKIEVNDLTQKVKTITITDIQGKELFNLSKGVPKATNNILELNMEKQLNKGLYFMQITTDKATVAKQIFIED